MGGAAQVKSVQEQKAEEKLSKWQSLALAQGGSLVQQDALDSYIRNCPRPERHPIKVEVCIDEKSRKFGDVQHLTSNRTQATKLWQYARLKGMDREYLEDTFGVWVSIADAVTIPAFVTNKMAWFFKALRLEVLKAFIPYEFAASVRGEQPATSESNETTSQEHEEQRANEQETLMPEEKASTSNRMHRQYQPMLSKSVKSNLHRHRNPST